MRLALPVHPSARRSMPIEYAVSVDGCWECISHAQDGYGYSVKKDSGKTKRIHRLVYEHYMGPIGNQEVVRHTCDNPSCIRPEHLSLGTHADNVADRVRRGRSAKGAGHGRAKLNEVQVRILRSATAADAKSVGNVFGVSPKLVRSIRNREIWVHIK